MESSNESDYGEDMLEMVESDDIEFLKSAIHNQSYSLLKRVRHIGNDTKVKRKKLNNNNDATLEHEYEEQIEEPVNFKNLLPIKTKKGIITRSIEEHKTGDKSTKESEDTNDDEGSLKEGTESDDEYVYEEVTIDPSKPKSVAELLATYNETLRNKKVHIGFLCTSLLENPEEKINNFRILFQILDEDTTDAYLSVRKLAVVSLLEVFKDILPSYQIRQHEKSEVKLKKDTLKLQKYENVLLQHYKKYLQKLEKCSRLLFKKRGDTRKRTEGERKLGELAVHAMSDLLVTHPYFNYSQNIAQAVIPFLNHAQPSVRQLVSLACKTIFKEDKKEEITLKILRIINHYLKNHIHSVKSDMLEVLLHLRIKDVNLDQEKEQDIKEKKYMSHKQNILQLSKKEKKRKKRLQELEKEMLETKAEENKQNKQKNLTEITKIVFGIYFRILKSSPNTKILSVCLEGLAKYSHCINLEYYVDLLNVLDRLLKEDWLGFREQLLCIQTVFAILSDQGEAINIDPTRFYITLYRSILSVHASKNYVNFVILLKTLNSVLIKRRKKITNKRLIGFVKRITTLSLQLLHNGALSCLGIVKVVLQLSKSADILLDLDTTVGDGDYLPELGDPEYCNGASASLFELTLLSRHYNPIVSKYARHIANGVPASGEGSLPTQFGKCKPEELFEEFDMSQMAFNPAIPIPKKIPAKSRPKRIQFVDSNFKKCCNKTIRSSRVCFVINDMILCNK